MKRFIISNLWWISFLAALVLLVSHTLSYGTLNIDNTTIILLLVLIVSPFAANIRRIKYGDFEAEIDPREVRRVKEDLEAQVATEENRGPANPTLKVLTKAIADLAENDPVLALAKLRIEIEKIVARLHERVDVRQDNRRPPSLGKMISNLTQAEYLSADISNPLREVISICNRAIHGEDIRPQDTESIIDTGAILLDILHSQAKSLATSDELESTVVDPSIVDEYRHARYRLTTLIPYSDENPVKNVRILDQDGLDAFLEGYEEFAEFVIDLRKLDSEPKAEQSKD